MKEEFNLSEKRKQVVEYLIGLIGKEADAVSINFIIGQIIDNEKEFIRRLKVDSYIFMGKNSWKEYCEFLDKLAGEKLK